MHVYYFKLKFLNLHKITIKCLMLKRLPLKGSLSYVNHTVSKRMTPKNYFFPVLKNMRKKIQVKRVL